MANISRVVKRDDQIELPPGFRFHPTDEELITHYLSNKVLDSNFCCAAIGEVDMNKVEPWELPWRAKMCEKEWYFFSVKDKKYPTGLRTNRATAKGYWKATGKDKEIYRGKSQVGMKKTLVFYEGRAPKGEKSNWVTHEYRLGEKLSNYDFPKPTKNDWVISRVFHKTSGGKKVHISGLMRVNLEGTESPPSALPPLVDPSPPSESEISHVHCFSNPIASQHNEQDTITHFNNFNFPQISNPFDSFPSASISSISWWNGISVPEFDSNAGFFDFQGFNWELRAELKSCVEKQRVMASLSQETVVSTENSSFVSNPEMGKRSFEDQEAPSTSIGPDDFDIMWDY